MENYNTITQPGQFTSSVGAVVDVATPSTRKLRALGFLWILLTLFPLALINYVIVDAFSSTDPILSTSRPIILLGAALMPILIWFALSNAVQRFHAASIKGRYFRSGPGGISVCLPDNSPGATFRFSFKTIMFDLRWDQIKTWYPYIHSINGVPVERSIVFETLNEERVKIQTYHFEEKEKRIAERIVAARSLPVTVADQAEVTNASQPDTKAFVPSLPPKFGEFSVQVKKKRELLKEIELRAIASDQRAAAVDRIANLLEAKLVSLCPIASGYRCSRKRYRPFREWKNIFGVRIFLRRGLLSGYEIQLEPNDSEMRMLAISICPSSLVADIRKYFSLGVGIVFALIAFKWWPIEYWLGDFADFTPFVLVAIFLTGLGVSAGVLQVPIGLFRLLASDKKTEEAKKEVICLGIREMVV